MILGSEIKVQSSISETTMSTNTFDDFITQQRAINSSSAIDWHAEKTAWLAALDDFYSKVKEFLQPYIEQEKIHLEFEPVVLNEEGIGQYDARRASIRFGSHQIRLEPVGTNLIGAKGRVDLVGPCGTVKFVLVEQTADGPSIKVRIETGGDSRLISETMEHSFGWAWKVATPAPRIRYLPLVAESFYDAIMQVTTG